MAEKGETFEGRAFIALLRDLEEALDPASFDYPDFNYWPILRFAINYKRKMGKSLRQGDAPAVSGLRRRWLTFSGRFRSPPAPPHIPAALVRPEGSATSVDVLYFNRKHQYMPGPDGALIQPFTDALRHITGDAAPASLTFVHGEPQARCLIPPRKLPKIGRFRPTALVDPRSARDLELRDAILDRLGHLNTRLADLAPHLQLSAKDVLVNIEMTSAKVHATRALLEEIAPKAVFLSSYTGAHHICAAAKPLGITVIDIQHGSMHRHHPLAANWHEVPAGGYELLPDIFWCWTARTAGYVSQTMPPCHQPIVGGNPKAALEQMLLPDAATSPARRDRPQILVALQYGAEALLMPHVLETYQQTRQEVDWHFRLHPMGWERLDEAVDRLGIAEETIVGASRIPLHQQLPAMDLLVTNTSTIVFEALEHAVRPVVCSGQGALTFDDLLHAGDLAYARDADTLRAEIRAIESSPERRRAVAPGGSADPAQIRRAFAEVLARAGR